MDSISKFPKVSVVVCTRNRGDSSAATLATIFQNKYPCFETILIDQSTNEETRDAIQSFLPDSRFRYFHSDAKGVGRARNLGLTLAQGEFVLFTDDDCFVPNDWIENVVGIFVKYPQVSITYSNVVPAPHDSSIGTIPHHTYPVDRLVKNILTYTGIGMGAAMSVRRDVVLKIGGFDENLGPGSRFWSGEDHDLALRTLLDGWWIFENSKIAVIHDGFRTFQEFRKLTGRDWRALGAVYAKGMKCLRFSLIAPMLYNLFVRGVWNPLSNVFSWRKPQGFKRFFYFWAGFFQALRVPVDKKLLVYDVQEF